MPKREITPAKMMQPNFCNDVTFHIQSSKKQACKVFRSCAYKLFDEIFCQKGQ
jgi:hypothetical protein